MHSAKRILFVFHGAKEGRPTKNLKAFIARCMQLQPSLAARIDSHHTDEPQPDLSPYKIICFWLGDPLKILYPNCYAHAIALEETALKCGIKVIQSPRSLSNTQKSVQAKIWQEAGVRCASAQSFETAQALKAALSDLKFPLILRSDMIHAQQTTYVCQTKADALKYIGKMTYPAVALEYIETRHSKSSSTPRPYQLYAHKKRSMVFGDIVANNHVFFSNSLIVGQKTSLFGYHSKRRAGLLRKLGIGQRDFEEALTADLAYFKAPPEGAEQMRHAVRALGLDMAAIDYSTLEDGELVLWEANPYFAVPHPPPAVLLPVERQLTDRYDRFYNAFIQWIAGEDKATEAQGNA